MENLHSDWNDERGHINLGKEIRKSDHVIFHRNPARVEFVASDPDDPEAAKTASFRSDVRLSSVRASTGESKVA
jgi:hypothetical protein